MNNTKSNIQSNIPVKLIKKDIAVQLKLFWKTPDGIRINYESLRKDVLTDDLLIRLGIKPGEYKKVYKFNRQQIKILIEELDLTF